MKKPTRKCLACSNRFEPKGNNHVVCSIECSTIKNNEKLEKAKAKMKKTEWTEKKAKMKKGLLTHKDYLSLLQKVFNEFIRLRDKNLPCISCGTTANIQYHAGHYFSSGGHPNLRFAETNVHKQCVQCNNYLHGNLINYGTALEKKIGSFEYEILCNNRDVPCKYSIPEIQELIKEYKFKTKELNKI